MASLTRPADASATRVWMGSRSSGGVSMTLMSRTPTSAMVERPGDRRRRQRQDVDLLLQLLEALLVGHAEALLLVHDDQPQVAEPDVLAQQPMGADDQVHGARGRAR